MKRLYWGISCLAVMATIALLGIYLYVFADVGNPTLSRVRADWGTFGDYVGGVLGTIFAGLAFIGVLGTLAIQRQQLGEMRQQFQLDELQRLIASLSNKVDCILDGRVSGEIVSQLAKGKLDFRVRDLISAGGHLALSRKVASDYLEAHYRDQRLGMIRSALASEIGFFQIEVSQLASTLKIYKGNGGSGEVLKFYYQRYAPIVCWVHAVGLLTACPNGEEFFEPQKHRELMEHDD